MMDLRVQKQHCTELKLLNQENHNPKKLLPPEAGIQLTLQAPMGHTLLKIKEMSILARQFCDPIRPVTANSLMLFGFAG